MSKVITIGREFGSGGRTVAKMTAEKLGIPCYDRELLIKIAEESGFSEEYIAEKGENATFSSILARGFSGQNGYAGLSAEDHLWQAQRKIILELAEKEACVIVGRCADYILRDSAECLRVFIYADMKARMERIVSVYGEGGNDPEKALRNRDKLRSTFYYYHTDMKWGAPHNYHVCLDSGKLGLEKCAEVIRSLY